jgi:hypothetical protein
MQHSNYYNTVSSNNQFTNSQANTFSSPNIPDISQRLIESSRRLPQASQLSGEKSGFELLRGQQNLQIE